VILKTTLFDVAVANACEVPGFAKLNPEDIDNDAESLPMI